MGLTEPTQKPGDAEAIINYVATNHAAAPFLLGDGEHFAAALPQGMRLHSIKLLRDEYLTVPERREGTVNLSSVEGFTDYVNRQKRPESAIYAEPGDKPALVAVLDHNPAGPEGTGWGRDRATYAFPLSVEWRAWKKAHGELVSQSEFAFFMEERAADIVEPSALDMTHPAVVLAARLGAVLSTPAEVVAASRGLKINAEVKVSESVVLESGESEIAFSERHVGEGGVKLRVPSAFLIGIPVFRGEPRDVMLVRLRYRRSEGGVKWCVSIHGADDALQVAFDETVKRVREATELPVFIGSPANAR